MVSRFITTVLPPARAMNWPHDRPDVSGAPSIVLTVGRCSSATGSGTPVTTPAATATLSSQANTATTPSCYSRPPARVLPATAGGSGSPRPNSRPGCSTSAAVAEQYFAPPPHGPPAAHPGTLESRPGPKTHLPDTATPAPTASPCASPPTCCGPIPLAPSSRVSCATASPLMHPRALVGALVYAFALRHAAQTQATHGFGDSIEAAAGGLIDADQILPELPAGWATSSELDQFAEAWRDTNKEAQQLLEIIADSLHQGAMSHGPRPLTQRSPPARTS